MQYIDKTVKTGQKEIKFMNLIDLTGKIAIVTGASGGIGYEISKIYMDNGAQVVGIDCSCEERQDRGIEFFKGDISKTDQCDKIFRKIIGGYGHVDILVNCAGITRDALTRKMTEEQFDEVIAVNLKGVWNMTRLVGPHMQENKEGSIINISSVVGFYGNIGQVNYAASKAGLVGMTKSWAKEFGYKGGGVRVNAIAPGYILTDMVSTVPQELLDKFAGQTMLGRLGRPEEIARVALFLGSNLSSYITGTTIHADGGMRL